ncbi:nucleotidyltransferase family protein [Solitalea koreensis]|uniref:CBS domain-containing protein n=1 Tax=Solitalea koreensis TaxID=543615 RepID=A0A521CP47_9SPHI|nr:nucleotidyltransferase family protein [Solitalea koreensis]SMO61155.1 CBS domain-containing protein [Solitalea koreensis]
MKDIQKHIIAHTSSARDALRQLDNLPSLDERTLFVLDEDEKIVGSVTDGDIRRGLLNDKEISNQVMVFMNPGFKFLEEDMLDLGKIAEFRAKDIHLIPIINKSKHIVRLLDLKKQHSVIPVSALIMAGGRGERLRPLTDLTPKPMLKVGAKPIIEHNVDRLASFGIQEIYISVKYRGEQIERFFGDGSSKELQIKYIHEEQPLGTLGALGLIQEFKNEHVLVMNSDILTNIDYEDFYKFYLESGADLCIASIPYQVKIPYAVLETSDNTILSFKEKPTYTYYSNGGIYLMNKSLQEMVPESQLYNATDLMEEMISQGKKVAHYPVLNYWLDIGRHEDFLKAQEDIKHLKL